MNLWQDGVVAMLAAVGVTAIVWTVASAFLSLGRRSILRPVVLLPAWGDAPALQQSVRHLERLRGDMSRRCAVIVILDCGLSPEGRRVGEILSREGRLVELRTAAELGKELMEKGADYGGIHHPGGDGT